MTKRDLQCDIGLKVFYRLGIADTLYKFVHNVYIIGLFTVYIAYFQLTTLDNLNSQFMPTSSWIIFTIQWDMCCILLYNSIAYAE